MDGFRKSNHVPDIAKKVRKRSNVDIRNERPELSHSWRCEWIVERFFRRHGLARNLLPCEDPVQQSHQVCTVLRWSLGFGTAESTSASLGHNRRGDASIFPSSTAAAATVHRLCTVTALTLANFPSRTFPFVLALASFSFSFFFVLSYDENLTDLHVTDEGNKENNNKEDFYN